MTVAVGGFTNALRTQRQLSALLASESNVSLAMEQITREARTGTDFSAGPSLLAFTNAQGHDVAYQLQDGVLEKSTDGGASVAITGSNATIDYFSVVLFGNVPGDHWNPRITLLIGVSPKDPTLASQVLHLQTTVSARTIDCDASGNC